jgi:hypothetical protein
MDQKQQAYEAAMLARMVGTHLHGVDNMTMERSNNPANKIDMNKFVASIVGQPANFNQPVTSGVSPAMLKAYEGVERLALEQVPDTSIGAQMIPMPPPVSLPQVNGSPSVQVPVPQAAAVSATNEDIQAIRSQLERMNATLTKMAGMLGKVFNTFNEKNKTN